MADDQQKSPPRRGILEEIGLHIPGFKGYLRQEYRRDADKAERDYLVSELKRYKSRVEHVKSELARRGQFDLLTTMEGVTDKLSRVISRVSSADYGYSGFFDTHQVGEETLKLLYEVDLALIAEAKTLETVLEPLSADQPEAELRGSLKSLEDAVVHFDRQFDKRKEMLKGAM